MIEEPYRWVEAIANRREYIEDQLRAGSPIVLVHYADGLLLFTVSRETRKIFEIYDRIAFAALGHPADIERMRLAAIDLAHIEGFSRAVNDVSLRRLANYGISPLLKTAFEQVFAAPHLVRLIMAEIGEQPDQDVIVKMDYDGSFARTDIESREPVEVVAGTEAAEKQMLHYIQQQLAGIKGRPALDDALKLAAKTWAVGMESVARGELAGEPGAAPPAETIDELKIWKEHLKGRHVEAGVLERNQPGASKFRLLEDKELRTALKEL
jgi:proteasome alpha subunit